MSFNYQKIGGIASKILKNFGQEATFTTKTTGHFDPAIGKAQTTETTFTGYGVKEAYTSREIDGTLIQAGDIKFMLENTSTTPSVSDTCSLNSIVYRIMSVDPLEPALDSVVYVLRLRK